MLKEMESSKGYIIALLLIILPFFECESPPVYAGRNDEQSDYPVANPFLP